MKDNKSKPNLLYSVFSKFVLGLLFLQLAIGLTLGQIRPVEISSQFIASSSEARKYFPVAPKTTGRTPHFRFGGGVVPRGTAQFKGPKGETIDAKDLKLVILDKKQLANSSAEYDTFGIQYKGQIYTLSAQDDLIHPLMNFIKRDSFIAYTLPVLGVDKNYFKKYELIEDGGGFVAKEFSDHAGFLFDVDMRTTTVALAPEEEAKIKKDIHRGKTLSAVAERGTVVNADFHVKYQVFLEESKTPKLVEIGGLPLSYAFEIDSDGSAIIEEVEIFKFPQPGINLQSRAILFFQMAAVFRQMQLENKPEFDRFLKEVESVVKQESSS